MSTAIWAHKPKVIHRKGALELCKGGMLVFLTLGPDEGMDFDGLTARQVEPAHWDVRCIAWQHHKAGGRIGYWDHLLGRDPPKAMAGIWRTDMVQRFYVACVLAGMLSDEDRESPGARQDRDARTPGAVFVERAALDARAGLRTRVSGSWRGRSS